VAGLAQTPYVIVVIGTAVSERDDVVDLDRKPFNPFLRAITAVRFCAQSTLPVINGDAAPWSVNLIPLMSVAASGAFYQLSAFSIGEKPIHQV